jgi:VWFA-related protein
MIRLRWQLSLLLLAMLAAIPAFSKSRQEKKQKRNATIAVTSRLVNVDVVVTDKQGNPVPGLTQKDFTVLDDGKPQQIALFSEASTRAPVRPPMTLQPDVYTNLLDKHGGVPPSVTIILLDSLNTALEDQSYARDQVFRFLRQIQPGDHIALYTLGKRLHVLHDFTTDASSLIAALSHYQPSKEAQMQAMPVQPIPVAGESGFEGRIIAQINSFVRSATEKQQYVVRENDQEITYLALDAIAEHVAGIPGRKNLIWVVGGLPWCFCSPGARSPDAYSFTNSAYFRYPIEPTLQHLAKANVAVYPVDARGLMGWPFSGGMGLPMQNLAKLTGGLAFRNTNDIMGSIRKAVDDAKSSYLIGYYPRHHDWKGEFRKLRVLVDQPGWEARARSGYYANPEAPLSQKPKDIRAVLASMAWSPLDATDIDFAARVIPVPSNAAREVNVTVRFDPHGIRFTSNNGNETASLQYAVFELDGKGNILTGTDKPANVTVSEAEYQLGLKEGMGFSFIIPLFTKAEKLSIVLRDEETGVAGSLHIPLANYRAPTAAEP